MHWPRSDTPRLQVTPWTTSCLKQTPGDSPNRLQVIHQTDSRWPTEQTSYHCAHLSRCCTIPRKWSSLTLETLITRPISDFSHSETDAVNTPLSNRISPGCGFGACKTFCLSPDFWRRLSSYLNTDLIGFLMPKLLDGIQNPKSQLFPSESSISRP